MKLTVSQFPRRPGFPVSELKIHFLFERSWKDKSNSRSPPRLFVPSARSFQTKERYRNGSQRKPLFLQLCVEEAETPEKDQHLWYKAWCNFLKINISSLMGPLRNSVMLSLVSMSIQFGIMTFPR